MTNVAFNAAQKPEPGALIKAIKYINNVTEVTSLLQRGADPNEKDEEGYSALMWAAASISAEIVKQLIEAGADVHYKNKEGETPLIVASRTGHYKMIRPLIEGGSNLDEKDKKGLTALDHAWLKGYRLVVEILEEAAKNIASAAAAAKKIQADHAIAEANHRRLKEIAARRKQLLYKNRGI